MAALWAKRSAWGLLATTLAGVVALASWEPFLAEQPGPPPPDRPYRAEVIRDEWGVPHIHGASDADVGFGVAWAHAEDDFATLQEVLAMVRGRLGALTGKDGAGVDYAYHLLGVRATARAHYRELPGDVRAVVDAYAAGLNRYAATHPREVRLARLFPVNGEDVAAGFALRQPFFFGLERDLKALTEGAPLPREHGPSLRGEPAGEFGSGGGDQLVPAAPMPLPDQNDGSNAFAVSARRSGDGTTRLLSNSHQPWRGGVAWYELEIRSDQGWHFAGATFPGAPWPFLGHNEDLGWTNTVNRPDLIDVYALRLDAGQSHYWIDGHWAPLARERVWLPVRFGPLVLPVPKWVWRSAHGPAVINARGAFALRYAGIDSVASLAQYYRITHAHTLDQWQAAMALQGVPATNFVYADKAGHIGLFYNAAIPDRVPGPDWRHAVPGTASRLIWQHPIPWERYPRNLDPASGFVFNSNNSPLLAAGPGSEIDPRTLPALWGVETDLTNRARRAVKLLAGTPVIDRDALLRIKFDTGYERAGYTAWMLDHIAALDLRSDPVLARAQKLLAGWDLRADGRNPADALAVMVLEPAMKASYGLTAPPDPRAALAAAATHLSQTFGRLDPPLGAVLRIRRGTVDLPMDGGGDTLRAATDWDIDSDGRLAVKHGDSFVMLVEWGKDGRVRSQSIQPYGAATTRPASPHYADQAALFAEHRFKPVHFDPADVAAHARSRIVVTNR